MNGARARVALALDAFMRSGLSRKDATDKIAKNHSGLRRLAGEKAGDFATTRIQREAGQEFRGDGTV
jgi:hypothetical protein